MGGSKGKKLKQIIGAIKDRASIIKAVLSTTRAASFSRLAVIRATTHAADTPPSENHIAAVMSLGGADLLAASAAIDAVIRRLHSTKNAPVGLKCLILLHRILLEPPTSLLRRHLSLHPNFLSLSSFHDGSSQEGWELSRWVRWYALVLEQSLEGNLGISSLTHFVEQVAGAPGSSFNGLTHEVTRLVGVEYGRVLKELGKRVSEIDRVGFDPVQLREFISVLNRLEECRDSVKVLFLNRKKNDAFWEMMVEVRGRVERLKKAEEEKKMVKYGLEELAGLMGRISGRPEHLYRFGPLDADRVRLTVSAVW